MSITTKKSKKTGADYLYFIAYDPETQGKKEVYCGRPNDPEARAKAASLRREYLEHQRAQFQQSIKDIDAELLQPTYENYSEEAKMKALALRDSIPLHEPRIYYRSSENMEEVDRDSVHLVITSPPYNVGKAYVSYNDKKELDEYLNFLDRVWIQCKRVLVNGGRIAINVADTFRQPYVPLHAHITQRMLALGFKMRGIVYWNKGMSVGVSTAWGSWRSPSNPTIRDVGEYILIFSKESFKLESSNKTVSMTPKDFTDFTKSVWNFQTSNGVKNGHPAPFPDELPRRLIKFYTYVGDTVLDPFMGSGTTCKVAKAWGRKSIGYEIDRSYKREIEKKISEVTQIAIPIDNFLPNLKQTTLDASMPQKESNGK
jgi:site-specific DNA-methyltransferase (adenine-specific)